MPCYFPWTAYRGPDGRIVFQDRGDPIQLPCGRCIGCRLERSRQWAVRIVHEMKMHDVSSFLTLTYDDHHLPDDLSLNKKHLQDFFKRLRSRGIKFRYFACGEYGDDYSRPHYHVCLFGYNFVGDRKVCAKSGQFDLYQSKFLDDVWSHGACRIGDLTFESAAYVSRYCVKVVNGDMAEAHYTRVSAETGEIYKLLPEFALMSSKPGIGRMWLEKYWRDVYQASDSVISRGHEAKPPRYYDKMFRKYFSIYMDNRDGEIDYKRVLDSRSRCGDNTEERLAVRYKVALAGLKLKRRS